MTVRMMSVAAIALWFVTIAVALFFFVRGQTQVMPDGRRAVMLTPDERNLVLTEMRGMLETQHGDRDPRRSCYQPVGEPIRAHGAACRTAQDADCR